jgi:hypothetical protein
MILRWFVWKEKMMEIGGSLELIHVVDCDGQYFSRNHLSVKITASVDGTFENGMARKSRGESRDHPARVTYYVGSGTAEAPARPRTMSDPDPRRRPGSGNVRDLIKKTETVHPTRSSTCWVGVGVPRDSCWGGCAESGRGHLLVRAGAPLLGSRRRREDVTKRRAVD